MKMEARCSMVMDTGEFLGREMILEVFAPGDVFGGATLLLPRHPATAVCMEPGVISILNRQGLGRMLGLG